MRRRRNRGAQRNGLRHGVCAGHGAHFIGLRVDPAGRQDEPATAAAPLSPLRAGMAVGVGERIEARRGLGILARGERGELLGEFRFHGRRELFLGADRAQRRPGVAADDAADHQRDGGEHRAHAVLLRLRAAVAGRAIAHQLNNGRQHGRQRADDGGDNGFGNTHSGNLKQARPSVVPAFRAEARGHSEVGTGSHFPAPKPGHRGKPSGGAAPHGGD